MMKRFFAIVFVFLLATPAHAVLGVGDITFDPSSYGAIVDNYKQMVKMYENAKKQLDTLASVERSINEAQRAYETLGSFSTKSALQGLLGDNGNIKSAAELRAAVANVEGGVSQNTAYVNYQFEQINQLDRLATLQKASADNATQAANKGTNTATNTAIAAQSAAATAALAAAAEQRRIKQETEAGIVAKAAAKNLQNSTKVYEAMGK